MSLVGKCQHLLTAGARRLLRGVRHTIGAAPHVLRLGVVGAVILSAVGLPIALAAGKSVKGSSDFFLAMPAEVPRMAAGQTSYVYAADGQTLLTTFYEEHRRYVRLDEISPYLQRAIIAAEDARFFDHDGVDFKGLARAFVANHKSGEVSQGASTLTMQYVRMALRDGADSPANVIAATEQTTWRKLREIRLALAVEDELSKAEILERYLNVAYFGHRAFGAFAAAEIFFSKHPADLNLVESATLAGLVKAPSAYDPASNDSTAALDRRNWVLQQMADNDLVPLDQVQAAQAEPLALNVTAPPNDCISVPAGHNDWGFFCDFFKSWWMEQAAFGKNPGERLNNLRRGGYRIVTTLDPHIQATAMDQVTSREYVGSVYALGLVAVQPGTGHVKAMAVNRNYSLDQSNNGPHTDWNKRDEIPGNYPNTVNPLLGGGDLVGYQAGSTFKYFTLMAALDAGLPPSTSFHSPHRLVSWYIGTPGEPSTCGTQWCPSNASASMTGTRDMRSGLGMSVNTYFVQLEQAIGADRAVRMAERLGLRWRSETDKVMASPERAPGWGSFTLGVADTTPLEMATAYATAAADGLFCEANPVASVTNPDGSPASYVDETGTRRNSADPQCRQEVAPGVARNATDALRCVTGYGAAGGGCGSWSTAGGVYGQVGRPVAGKTGTTDSNRAAWFVGYTPQLAVASFMADPDNPFNAVGLGNSSKPINAAANTLRESLAGQEVAYFPYP